MSELHENERLLFGAIAAAFLALTGVIAVGPALRVQSAQKPLPNSEPMSSKQRRGLKVYVDEGCAYCHTQQVRPVPSDESLGRPSVAGDFARLERLGLWRQTPAVLGSERTGPDLSNVGRRQPSRQWHYLHLYNPRAVVADSIMPAFPWLFRIEENPPADATTVPIPKPYGPEEGEVVPTSRARALVAYLTSLEQAELPAGSGEVAGEGAEPGSKTGGSEHGDGEGANGAGLYEANCASCHQANGRGVPGTFPPLVDDPVVTANDPARHVEIVLEGLRGKSIEGTDYSAAMPGFGGRLDDEQVAAVVNHERTSWGNDSPPVSAEEVAEIRRALDEDERDEDSEE